ncbi:glycosyltransferase [Candidatus Woesearchaeota archaeon]|nr:glycosyltransferase [Candidatus Woesearchaeota archaeon]
MGKHKQGISIVIPTLNEEKNIDELLANIMGLEKSSEKPGEKTDYELEIIVADANSKDKTRQVAEAYGARVIHGGLPGHARNQGARFASHEMVYFLDADVRIQDKDFIGKSFQEFRERNLDCAGMDNYLLWSGNEKAFSKSAANLVFGVANAYIKGVQNTKNPRAVSTAMIVKRPEFITLGGFDENIYWGEDSELAKRFASSGYKFGILDSVSIKVSPRKAVSQGSVRFAKNVLRLNAYRSKHGEVSREIYNQLTGIQDYFARANPG